MSISKLLDRPPPKRVVQTILLENTMIHSLIKRLIAHVKFGTKIIWVTPLIHPNENFFGSSAYERFDQLSGLIGDKVGLLHGDMDPSSKLRTLELFKSGIINIIVTTTIIEVGIDIPDASICVIDCAEQFGLSQLHQLRG